MKLTQEQDAVMNAIFTKVEMLAEGKDTVVGGMLVKADFMRIARAALNDINILWNVIGYSSTATLGYAPCPWNSKHAVGYNHGNDTVSCQHSACPGNRIRVSMLDWNRRED